MKFKVKEYPQHTFLLVNSPFDVELHAPGVISRRASWTLADFTIERLWGTLEDLEAVEKEHKKIYNEIYSNPQSNWTGD